MSRWRHYGRSDGLIWDDCNTNAFLAEAGGAVDRHQPRVVAISDPPTAPAPNVPPPVVFTSVKLGDQEVDPSTAAKIPYRAQFAAGAVCGADVRAGIGRVVPLPSGRRAAGMARNQRARAELSQAAAGAIHAGSDGTQRAGRVERGAGAAQLPGSDAVVADVVVPGGGGAGGAGADGRLLWQRRTYRLEDGTASAGSGGDATARASFRSKNSACWRKRHATEAAEAARSSGC